MRRNKGVLALVVAVVASITVLGPGGPPVAAQAAEPELVVTPSTGLVDQQVVQVSGTGLLPSTTVFLVMCPTGVTNGFDCDLMGFTSATTDATGAFSRSLTVKRYITARIDGISQTVDCADVGCVIGAGDIEQQRVALAPVELADIDPPATFAATPVAADRQVTFSGAGWPGGLSVTVSQCPSETSLPIDCERLTVLQASAAGNLPVGGATRRVHRDLVVVEDGIPGTVDCLVRMCVLRASEPVSGLERHAALDLSAVSDHPVSVAASPTTGILDLDAVEVDLSGFVPGEVISIAQCPQRPDAPSTCVPQQPRNPNSVVVTADPAGEATASIVVRRDLPRSVAFNTPPDEWVDCLFQPCYLLVESVFSATMGSMRRVVVPLEFADVPRAPIDPVLALAPGSSPDVHTLTGSGFPLGGQFSVGVCRGVAPPVCHATPSPITVVPDSEGRISAQVPLPRFDRYAPETDCLLVPCTVTVRVVGQLMAESPPLTLPTPVLTVEVHDAGTLHGASGEAVVRATVSCDVPTPVSAWGSVTQGGAAGGFRFEDQPCHPDEPLLAFFPSRDLVGGVLSLGAAAVEVSATPYRSSDDGQPVTASASVDLVDHAAVEAWIVAAMADPAEVELRELVVRSILARVAQDPVFAEQWRIAVGGG